MKLVRDPNKVNTIGRTIRKAEGCRARPGLAMSDQRRRVGRGFIIMAMFLMIGAIWASGVAAWPLPEPSPSEAESVAISPDLVDALAGRPGGMAILALDAADDDDAAIAAAQGRALAALGSDFVLTHRYRHIPALAGRLSQAGLVRLASVPGLQAVSEDPEVRVLLEESVPYIGADRLRRQGVDGDGVNVAIIDTGVDSRNIDLRDAIVDQICMLVPRDRCGSGNEVADDLDGHGTHVAGIVASRGRRAGHGVAPAAGIIAVKFIESRASGATSNFLDTLDTLIEREDIDIINMSLGVGAQLFSADCDESGAAWMAMADAFRRLDRDGVISVAASGNDGERDAMAAPACISTVVSVGAIDHRGRPALAEFTNRSPSLDLLAPGVAIESTDLQGGLGAKSGTSMAAPHVAGAFALLREIAPWANKALLLSLLQEQGQRPTISVGDHEVVTIDVQAAAQVLNGLTPTATPHQPTVTPIPPSETPEPATTSPTAVQASATPTEDPATAEPSPTTRPTDPAIPTPEPTSEALPAYLPRLVRP